MTLKTRDTNDSKKWKEYTFNSFDVFYIFIQKIVNSYNILKRFRIVNFESDLIKKIFKDFYITNQNQIISLKKINNEVAHFKCVSQWQEAFWLERGWDNAKQLVSDIQTYNANLMAEKLKKDPTSRTSSSQLLWWTKKGYTEEEAIKLRAERQRTFTKEKCIEKYGKEKGTNIYNNRQAKWRKTIDEKYSKETQDEWRRKAKFHSNQSTNLFKPFYEQLKNEHECFLAPYTEEFFINTKHGFYLYDFVIKDLKLIFEFNGSHVHANPSWPKEKLDNWHHAFTHQNAYDNMDAFNQKILTAEALGFKVIVLWDDNENNSKIISDVIFPKQNMPQQ